jgi:hypothetical protein
MHHVHHHVHHVRGGFGPRRRRWRFEEGDFDRLVAWLEERQRDHEQAAADLADKIRHLKEYRASRQATGQPADEQQAGASAASEG